MSKYSKKSFKRFFRLLYVIFVVGVGVWQLYKTSAVPNAPVSAAQLGSSPAALALQKLVVKGRAAKTGYSRALFSDGWGNIGSCDVRNFILARDLQNVTYVGGVCKVATGTLDDPYTGKTIEFVRGQDTSDDVQIDHVVALGDAWQKGAQNLSPNVRYALANDPLELVAVDGQANQNKGDSDAASWLPENKAFRCSYVARQIAVKTKYTLWITPAEYASMAKVLTTCPDQSLPEIGLLKSLQYAIAPRL